MLIQSIIWEMEKVTTNIFIKFAYGFFKAGDVDEIKDQLKRNLFL